MTVRFETRVTNYPDGSKRSQAEITIDSKPTPSKKGMKAHGKGEEALFSDNFSVALLPQAVVGTSRSTSDKERMYLEKKVTD
eukprot:370049-Amorphochlora_amoeboformis.AAC.1